MRGCAELLDCGTVIARGVTFVFVPMVLRVLLMKVEHSFVAVSFGENACCSDVGKTAVAFDKCLPRYVVVRLESVAVDNNSSRADFQSVESAVHSENACVEDVDAVDFFGCDYPYSPSDGFGFDYWAKGVALMFGELL